MEFGGTEYGQRRARPSTISAPKVNAISGEACPLKSAQDLALLLEIDDPDCMPSINAHAATHRRKLVRHESITKEKSIQSSRLKEAASSEAMKRQGSQSFNQAFEQAQEAKRKALESDTSAASLARVREAVAGADQDGDDVITVTELEEAGGFNSSTQERNHPAPKPLENCHPACWSMSGSGFMKRSGHDGLCPNNASQPKPPTCNWCTHHFRRSTRHYGKCLATREISLHEHALYQSDFRRFDADGTGYLERPEILELLSHQLGRPARDAEVELLLRAIDLDTDGKITMKEYMNSVLGPGWQLETRQLDPNE